MKKLPPRVSKRKSRPGARIIFITGTDTGVGKTLLTGLLCSYLQASGAKVRAIKPICCGDRADIDFLRLVQPEITSDAEINECYFHEQHFAWVRFSPDRLHNFFNRNSAAFFFGSQLRRQRLREIALIDLRVARDFWLH